MLATFKLYSPVTTAIRDVTFIPFGFFFFFFLKKKKSLMMLVFLIHHLTVEIILSFWHKQYQKVED